MSGPVLDECPRDGGGRITAGSVDDGDDLVTIVGGRSSSPTGSGVISIFSKPGEAGRMPAMSLKNQSSIVPSRNVWSRDRVPTHSDVALLSIQ